MGFFTSARLVVVLIVGLGACAADADDTSIDGRAENQPASIVFAETEAGVADASAVDFEVRLNGLLADDPAVHDFGSVAHLASPTCVPVSVSNSRAAPLIGGPIDVDSVFRVSGPLSDIGAGQTVRFEVCAVPERVGGHETTVVLPFADYTITFEVDVVRTDADFR